MPEFLNPINDNSIEDSDNGSPKGSPGQRGIESGSQTSSPMAPHDGEVIEYTPHRRENQNSERQKDKPRQRTIEVKQSKPKPYKPYVSSRRYDNKKPDPYPSKNIIRSLLGYIKILFSYLFLPDYPQRKSGDQHGRRERYRKNYRNRRSGGRNRRQGGNNNNDSRNRQGNRGSDQSQSSNTNRRGGRNRGNRNQERGSNSNAGDGETRNLNQSRNRRRDKPRSGQPNPENDRPRDSQE